MERKILGSRRSQKLSIEDIKAMVVNTEDKVWNVQTLAQELGTTPDTVRKRIQRGLIPAHKEGRSWYILKSEYIRNLRNK